MFDSLGNFLQVASGILVVTSLAGLGLMRGTVVNLRERLNDHKDEIVELKAENVELKAKVDQQSQDLGALQRVITGEEHWVAISRKLEEHHDAAVHHWLADEELLGMILQALNRKGKP